jgi:CheY-like chemotaxis protein
VRVLSQQGYDVVALSSGAAAIEQLSINPSAFEMLIADVVMPHVGGIEVAQRLRQESPELPVIYMSGYADSRILDTSRLSRYEAFLRKPFSPFDLVRRVRDMLDAICIE